MCCLLATGQQVIVELGKQVNPGYAGRSNLPDNMKQPFRNLSKTKPDRQLIARVMIYSQGFRTAEKLVGK